MTRRIQAEFSVPLFTGRPLMLVFRNFATYEYLSVAKYTLPCKGLPVRGVCWKPQKEL